MTDETTPHLSEAPGLSGIRDKGFVTDETTPNLSEAPGLSEIVSSVVR